MDALGEDQGIFTYEGKAYALKDLMKKLEEEIGQMAERLNRIASLLGDLHHTLKSTRTIDVKLSLSAEEYERFKSLRGNDDRERILQAIRSAFPPAGRLSAAMPEGRIEPMVASLAHPKTEPLKEMKSPEQTLIEELSISVSAADEPQPPVSPAVRKMPSLKCPRCSEPLVVPDRATHKLPMEITCSHCGAKCMIKSRANSVKSEKAGFEPLEDSSFGNLFDMLST